MCSHAEWENLVRSIEEAIGEGQVRDLVSDAAARIDALIDSVMGWACAPDNADWACAREPRSRREWVV
jgi:hypothetical protein